MKRQAITSQELLILIVQWSDGEIMVDEFVKGDKTRTMSHADVQERIDSLVDCKRSVIAVKRLDMETGHAEDISEDFDIRTVKQVEEDAAHAAAIAERRGSTHAAFRQQRQLGTLNHAQQGIAR